MGDLDAELKNLQKDLDQLLSKKPVLRISHKKLVDEVEADIIFGEQWLARGEEGVVQERIDEARGNYNILRSIG